MDNRLCVIFGSDGEYAPRKKFGKTDLIISTVGGFYKAEKLGIAPDAAVGDFGSGKDVLDTDAFVVKIDRDGDDTEILAAIKIGLRRGYTSFVIYGGTGNDLGATAANIAALSYLNAYSAQGYLVDGERVATVFTDGSFVLPPSSSGEVSVFAYGGTAQGVSAKNLDRPLDNAELDSSLPLRSFSVSRRIDNAKKTEISVKHGSLLVVFPR